MIEMVRSLLLSLVVLSLAQITYVKVAAGVVPDAGSDDRHLRNLSAKELAHALESIRDARQLSAQLNFDTSETPVARGPQDVQGRTCLVTNQKYVSELVAMMSELKVVNAPQGNDEYSIRLTFERGGEPVFEAIFPAIFQATPMTVGVVEGRYAEFGADPVVHLTNFALDAFSQPSERKPCSKITGSG